MFTADTITDEQIRELLIDGSITEPEYHCALLVLKQHGSLGPRVRREARARCAEILNTRAKER